MSNHRHSWLFTLIFIKQTSISARTGEETISGSTGCSRHELGCAPAYIALSVCTRRFMTGRQIALLSSPCH